MVCIVYGCQYGSKSYKGPKRRCLTIPKGRQMRKIWLEKINRKGFHPKAKAFVCEIHFKDEDFLPIEKNAHGKLKKKRQLKPLATPKEYLRGELQPFNEINENDVQPIVSNETNVLHDHIYNFKQSPPLVEIDPQDDVNHDHSYNIDYEMLDIQSEIEVSCKFIQQ